MEAMLFEAIAAAPDLESRLEYAADAYFKFVESDPPRWHVLFGGDAAVAGEVAQEAMELHLATERRFAELFAAAAPGADGLALQAAAHAVGGAAHQLAQWWLRTPGIPREQVVKWYRDLTWNGLGALIRG
jgi:hypothetical protein